MRPDLNVKDEMGFTPLKIAETTKQEEMIQLLRKHGAKD